MSAKKNIGRNGFVYQFWILRGDSRIGVRTEICVGPSVESALLYVGEVIGNQIVTQSVALLNSGGNRVSVPGYQWSPMGTPRAGGINLMAGSVRIVSIDRRTAWISPVSTFPSDPTPTYNFFPAPSKRRLRVQ